MKSEKWNIPASDYSNNVLSVFDHDSEGKIISLIDKLGGPQKRAIDLGCGTGKFLPCLTKNFAETLACDYSKAMIKSAKKYNKGLKYLNFETCNLEDKTPKAHPYDLGLCVNVIITQNIRKREKIWENIIHSIKENGYLILVLPSLESALYSKSRLVEWNIRNGLSAKESLINGFETTDKKGKKIARGGIIKCGGVATKHYLKEEIISTTNRFGLKIIRIQRIEYPWCTEFIKPPKWMKEPYPWDWLVLLQK